MKYLINFLFLASEKISENLHIFANEPSLACYRLQEHIHKSLPQLVLKRVIVLYDDTKLHMYYIAFSFLYIIV